MASPVRLDADLVMAAEQEGKLQKRSVPKQIEYWAELGQAVEQVIDITDVLAIVQGLKKVTVTPVSSPPIDPLEVFDKLERARNSGALSKRVTDAAVYFEASRTNPGLLDRVDTATGERLTGQFIDGIFTVIQ
ncbi:MAG: hypothetical protein QNJ97_08925 [Myxococcota bacterium]|nr:hypothetical protein [Myxococcota bacterium]